MKVKLGDVCDRETSNVRQGDVLGKEGAYPIYGAAGLIGNVDFFHQNVPYVAVVKDGAGVGRTMLLPGKSSVIGTMQYLVPKKNISAAYLKYVVQHMRLEKYCSGATIPHIYFRDYKNEEFTLSPPSEQVRIVDSLGRVERMIEIRRHEISVLDDLIKARFVEMFGDSECNNKSWPVRTLNSLCTIGSSKRVYQEELGHEGVPFLRVSDLVNKISTGVVDSGLFVTQERYEELQRMGLVPVEGDILVTSRGTIGRCYIVAQDDRFYFQDGMISWLSGYDAGITSVYLKYLFMTAGLRKQITCMQAGSTICYLSIAMLRKLRIMLPPIELQERFAAFVAQVDKSKFRELGEFYGFIFRYRAKPAKEPFVDEF